MVGEDEALFALEPPVPGELDIPSSSCAAPSWSCSARSSSSLVAAGVPVVDAKGRDGVSHTAQAVRPGLMVMAVIYFMGAVGGPHCNPVMAFSFALRRALPSLPLPRTTGQLAPRRPPGPRAPFAPSRTTC
jgi:hypothetical protein